MFYKVFKPFSPTKTMEKWNTKCRFFNEKYACDTLTSEGYSSCIECKFASEFSKKILIIKFGALGDVVRTTPLLEALKNKYPDCLIYWLTTEKSKEILENNPYVDKILVYNPENILRIQQEKFDILYSLEIDTPPTLLANIANAKEKYGYYFDNGATSCFNKGAEEYLETAFLTHVKLANRKTYQQLIFQACEFKFNKQEPTIELSEKEKKSAEDFLKENNLSKKILGINFSAGNRWPSKSWSEKQLIELIKQVKDYKILLLGGPEETEKLNDLKKQFPSIAINESNNSIKEFAAIINKCDHVITTDSLALHLATALKKPTTALFFSTPAWEVEDYGRIIKLQSPLLEKNFFSNKFSEELANSITTAQVIKTL